MRIGNTDKRNIARALVLRKRSAPNKDALESIGDKAYYFLFKKEELDAMLALPPTYFTWARTIKVGDMSLPMSAPRPFPVSVGELTDEQAENIAEEYAAVQAYEAEFNEEVSQVYDALSKYTTLMSLLGHEPRLWELAVNIIGEDLLKEAGVGQQALDKYFE